MAVAKVLDIDSDEYRLGQNIRKYRMIRGMTQNDLADLVDTDRAAISNYENGVKGEMGFRMLMRLGVALGVTADALLGEENGDDLAEMASKLNEEHRKALKEVAAGFLLIENKICGLLFIGLAYVDQLPAFGTAAGVISQ